MIRKILMVGAAATIPLGAVVLTSGVAGAGTTTDATATATATCTTSGGTVSFKYGLGLPGTSWVPPKVDPGPQTTKVAKVDLSCTSSAVSGTFTGVAAGTITQLSSDYSAAGLSGVTSDVGSLTIKWKAPSGQKFGGGTSSKLSFIDVLGGTGPCVANPSDTCGTFSVPGTAGSATVTGSFAGTDSGASSTTISSTTEDEVALLTAGAEKKGITKLVLASGTSFLG